LILKASKIISMKYKFTLLLFLCAGILRAQWSNTTNQFLDSLHMPVCKAVNDQGQSLVIKSYPDSGYIVVWEDFRNGVDNYDIYAQKYDKNGIAQWAADGVPVATGPDVQRFSGMGNADYRSYGHVATDSTGGFYVAWEDWNTVNTGVGGAHRVCVQHIKADGSAVFPGIGYIVAQPTTQNTDQYAAPQLIADGNNGFFIGYLQLDPFSTRYTNLFVYCFREEAGTLKNYGGGKIDVDQVQAQQNSFPCGILVLQSFIGTIDDRVQGFHIYPDANKGCGIVYTFTRNSGPPIGGWFMAYNHLCRIKKDCVTTKIRRRGLTGTIPTTAVYKKDEVAKLYDFIVYDYTNEYRCADNSIVAVINHQIENGGAGYALVSNKIASEIYSLGFPKGAVLETTGNINAQMLAVTERSYINGQVTPYKTLSFFIEPVEKYDSIPYQLTTDLTHPDWASNPAIPPSINKINGSYDTLLDASSADFDFSLTSGGNRAFASTFVYNGKYNPGIQGTLLLQEIKVERKAADSFYIHINNTSANKGVVAGKEVATGFQGSEIKYGYPQVAMDSKGNALFYVREYGRYNRVSPIGDSAKLLWGTAGKPSGNNYGPDNPFAVMGGDGTAVIGWQDNRLTNPSTGLNIYMRHLDSLTNNNYLPPFKKVASFNSYQSLAFPQILTGYTGQFISFDLFGNSNWSEVAQVADQYNLGVVYMQAYENSNVIRKYGGIPYLDRNYLITPQNNPSGAGNVGVRLFFTQAQFDALKAADTSITSPANLVVIKQPGTSSVATAYVPVPGEETIVPTSWSVVDGGYYLEINVNSFSNFFMQKGFGIVPVKWVNINADWQGVATARVSWVVGEQLNVSSYAVQHSTDGITYSNVCVVKPTSIYSYQCTVPAQSNLINYYRVVEKDKDGIEIYSKTVTLKPVDVVDFLKVYPNPASTQVYIESNEMIAGITVYDMLGRVQFQKTYNNKKISINTSGLSNGAYELIIKNEAGKIYRQRLVVQ
jgi:hypothetical protein